MVKNRIMLVAVAAVCVSAGAGNVFAVKKANIETGLLGVKLYSTGFTVIQKYGSPISIEPITVGTNSGGAGGGGGPTGGGGGGAAGGGGGGGGATASAKGTGPSTFSDSVLFAGPGSSGPGGGAAMPQGRPGGGPMGGPKASGNAGGGPTTPGAGGAGGASGAGTVAEFTRWIYRRNGCQYGFIFDKYNRVVQIEAIGIHNGSVRTHRGVSLGASISEVIKKYAHNMGGEYDPPAYEINGNTIVMKFLVKNHVAFQFSKLQANGPEVVTGIAVAGGKY